MLCFLFSEKYASGFFFFYFSEQSAFPQISSKLCFAVRFVRLDKLMQAFTIYNNRDNVSKFEC